MSNLGAPELLIIVLVLALPLLIVFGIVDAARRPEWAFAGAGQNKTMWVALQALGLFVAPLGAVLTLTYLLSIRPKLTATA